MVERVYERASAVFVVPPVYDIYGTTPATATRLEKSLRLK